MFYQIIEICVNLFKKVLNQKADKKICRQEVKTSNFLNFFCV
jgi:hypothetical protein